MTSNAASAVNTKVENIDHAIYLIDSSNINEVIRGLNYLLQKSYEANEISSSNNAVFIEHYPHLLPALGNLLDLVNPSGKLPFQNIFQNQDQNYYSFLFGDVTSTATSSSSMNEWHTDLPGIDSIEFKVQ